MTMTKLCFLINCRQHLCWGVQPIRNRQVHICKQRCFKEGMSARNQLISQIYYGTLQNTETKMSNTVHTRIQANIIMLMTIGIAYEIFVTSLNFIEYSQTHIAIYYCPLIIAFYCIVLLSFPQEYLHTAMRYCGMFSK